jgi:hypothetical protein
MSLFKSQKIAAVIKQKPILILFAFVLLGLFLRLYHFSDLFYYTMDEEVMNLIQRRIVLGEHYPLIGSVSPLSTYLGPIFYYFGAAVLFLSKLNPLGQSLFGIMFGTFNIFLIYKVAKDLFNEKVGLFAAALYSGSFLMVIFDRRYWHLTPGPFLSLLILWSILKIKQGSIKFVYLLIAALIFGWNTDYTNLVLFLFTGLAWIVFKLPVRRKEILIALIIFLISNIPLAVFDLRHDFLNTRALMTYLTRSHQQKPVQDRETLGKTKEEQATLAGMLPSITFSRAIYTFSDLNISEQHTYCKDYIFDRNQKQGWILPGLAFLIILTFAWLTWKNRRQKDAFNYQLVLSFYLIFQMGILFYAYLFMGDIYEHYLATLLPYFFIMMAVILALVYKKSKFLIILILMGFFALNINLVIHAYNPLGFKEKNEAVSFILSNVKDQDFSLESIGSCYRYDGFYYPLLLAGRHPVKSYQDSNYSWLYNYQVAEKNPSKIVVMVSRGRFETEGFFKAYQKYQPWVTDRKTFDGLEVLILDNSKGDFN